MRGPEVVTWRTPLPTLHSVFTCNNLNVQIHNPTLKCNTLDQILTISSLITQKFRSAALRMTSIVNFDYSGLFIVMRIQGYSVASLTPCIFREFRELFSEKSQLKLPPRCIKKLKIEIKMYIYTLKKAEISGHLVLKDCRPYRPALPWPRVRPHSPVFGLDKTSNGT